MQDDNTGKIRMLADSCFGRVYKRFPFGKGHGRGRYGLDAYGNDLRDLTNVAEALDHLIGYEHSACGGVFEKVEWADPGYRGYGPARPDDGDFGFGAQVLVS